MKLFKMTMALALMLSLSLAGCKPKDSEIKAKIESKLSAEAPNVMVSVTEGVATLTGEVKDEATKTMIETDAKTAGATSVVNNTMVTPAFTPPVIVSDDPLSNSVRDATKDYPGVNAVVSDGVIMLTGTIEKANLPKLMMTLNGLGAKRIDNKLETK